MVALQSRATKTVTHATFQTLVPICLLNFLYSFFYALLWARHDGGWWASSSGMVYQWVSTSAALVEEKGRSALSWAPSPVCVTTYGWMRHCCAASWWSPTSCARSCKVEIDSGLTRSSVVELPSKLRPREHDGGGSGFYPHEGDGDHAGPERADGGSASTHAWALCSEWSMLAGDPTAHNEVSEALLRFPINGDDGEVSPPRP
jgi:hypothetical protein